MASAFWASASRSLRAISIAAVFALIFVVQGWSSFCLTSIWSWNVWVLSRDARVSQGIAQERHDAHPSNHPWYSQEFVLPPLDLPLVPPHWPYSSWSFPYYLQNHARPVSSRPFPTAFVRHRVMIMKRSPYLLNQFLQFFRFAVSVFLLFQELNLLFLFACQLAAGSLSRLFNFLLILSGKESSMSIITPTW